MAHAATVVVGDQLGLYKALAKEPATPDELGGATGTDARYVREWLCAQAASGYAHCDAASGRFALDEEQAFALANEDSPAFIPGAFQIAMAMFDGVPRLVDAFRSGRGIGWHEQHRALFAGTERFFRPGYVANLVSEWLPALDGVAERARFASPSSTACTTWVTRSAPRGTCTTR